MTRWICTATVATLFALALAGCGSDGDSNSGHRSAPKSDTVDTSQGIRGNDAGPNAGQAEGKLAIRLEHVGDKASGAGVPVPEGLACTRSIPASCHGTVTCPVDTAKDPDGAAVCTWLAGSGREALTVKPAKEEACTMQYGGPETAHVTGTIDGTKVDANFSRTNGCEIARYDDAARLWGGSAPSGSGEPEVVSDPPEAFS